MLLAYWLGAVVSALVAGGLFTLLGAKLARLSLPDAPAAAHWLLGPTLGFAVWTAISVAFWSAFRLPCLATAPLAVAVVAGAWLWKRQVNPPLSALVSVWPLFLVAAALGVLPLLTIAPIVREGAIVFGVPIFDHMKVALIDAFHRQGFPPVNPFAVVDGQAPPLNYYYAWFAVAAMLRNIPGVSGWAADAALTWVTAVSTLLAIAGLALCLTTRRAAAWLAMLSALPLGLHEPLSWALGDLYVSTFAQIDKFETWAPQAAWVPQHLFAGISVVLCLYLVARLLSGMGPRWTQAIVLGLAAAAAMGSSIYAGALAFAGGAPLAAIAVATSPEIRGQIRRWLPPLALAVVLALLAAAPVLGSIARLSAASSTPALAWRIYPVLEDPRASKAALIALYWAVYLFIQFGFVFLASFLGLAIGRRDQDGDHRPFVHLSLAYMFGNLLIAQFLHSIISNNDLGWRVAVPPMLLMVVWSGVAIDWLVQRAASGWPQARSALVALAVVAALAGVGSFATGRFCLQALARRKPSGDEVALGIAVRRQSAAWREVRALTAPRDIVAVSPTAFLRVIPYTANAPAALFSDRTLVVSDRYWPHIYSHQIPQERFAATWDLVNQIFNGTPQVEQIRTLADAHHGNAQAVLVTPRDRLWSSEILVQSGLYALAAQTDDHRIYLRTPRQ